MADAYLELIARQNREAQQQKRDDRKPKREDRDARRRDMTLPSRPETDEEEDAA